MCEAHACPAPDSDKPSLATLEVALTYLPDATYEDLADIKPIWEMSIGDDLDARGGR